MNFGSATGAIQAEESPHNYLTKDRHYVHKQSYFTSASLLCSAVEVEQFREGKGMMALLKLHSLTLR